MKRLWVVLSAMLLGTSALAWNPRYPLPHIPCAFFPPDNVWTADISSLPVDPRSDDYVASIGAGTGLHPDFGTRRIGIPYTVADSAQTPVTIQFTAYGEESDPGPYPVPRTAPVERGSDRHVLVVQAGSCGLYELFGAHRRHRGALWLAASGAFWDLGANDLRTADWTSADAAGLPILPGLVRHEEATGVTGITHALRFTAPRTRSAYVWPARHEASSDGDPALPPMGVRFRLKASIDLSGVSPTNQAILTALKTYGMFLADNGSAWFISGAPDPAWNDDDLHQLGAIHGSDFEAVDESGLMVDPNSGQVQ